MDVCCGGGGGGWSGPGLKLILNNI